MRVPAPPGLMLLELIRQRARVYCPPGVFQSRIGVRKHNHCTLDYIHHMCMGWLWFIMFHHPAQLLSQSPNSPCRTWQMVEHSALKSTQPRSETWWRTLYYSYKVIRYWIWMWSKLNEHTYDFSDVHHGFAIRNAPNIFRFIRRRYSNMSHDFDVVPWPVDVLEAKTFHYL